LKFRFLLRALFTGLFSWFETPPPKTRNLPFAFVLLSFCPFLREIRTEAQSEISEIDRSSRRHTISGNRLCSLALIWLGHAEAILHRAPTPAEIEAADRRNRESSSLFRDTAGAFGGATRTRRGLPGERTSLDETCASAALF
jgi:hypothetical protein